MNAIPNTCRECGSEDLKWFADVQNVGQAQDGRIKLNEVRCIFVLGCEYCSETIRIVSGDEIAVTLNAVKDIAKALNELKGVSIL